MNEISIFHFQGSEVRIVNVNDEPWFCLADVCKVLDIANVGNCKARLNEKGIRTMDTPTAGGIQAMTFINEPNLYKAVFQSRKPEAEQFTDWVTSEVLPSIRKHGGYIKTTGTETPEELYARALTSLKAALDRQKAITAEQAVVLKLQAPDVEYARNVLASDGLHTVNAVAVHLGISAIRLNKFLIAENWIYRQGDVYYPAIRIREKGYCDFHVVPYLNSQGERMTREHLKWTEAGRRAIIELWNKRHPAA